MTEYKTPASEIERDQWAAVFDDLTRRRAGQPVHLEAFGWNIGVQTEVRGLLLRSISYGGKGGDASAIEILLGTEPDDHITHRIGNATAVRIKRLADSKVELVAIESGDGYTCLLDFGAVPGAAA
jgi:hypothetical protein